MTHKDLLELINSFINHLKLDGLVFKTWIYKDQTVVVDCYYKQITFAFDIISKKNNQLDISLVDRNDHVVYLYKKNFNKKIFIEQDVLFKNLEKTLLDSIYKVVLLIDEQYQYDVSVIIPVYNRDKLIGKCIESLNNQTLDKSRYQVIFIDDCSTDKSVESIHSLVDPRLNYKVLLRPIGSGGASVPRNEGVNCSKSKYILFLDSDDYISRDCLKNAYEFSEINNSDIVFLKIGSDSDNPRGFPVRPYKFGNVAKADLINHHLSRSNYVFRLYKRSFLLFENIVFDPLFVVGEDKIFTIHLLSKTNKVSILADQTYVFMTRHNEGHLSQSNINLDLDLYMYTSAYSFIFNSNLSYEYRIKLYNVWTVKVIERLIAIIKSRKISASKKYDYFLKSTLFINFNMFYIEKNYIYKEYHYLLCSLIEKNYYAFEALVNDAKNIF